MKNLNIIKYILNKYGFKYIGIMKNLILFNYYEYTLAISTQDFNNPKIRHYKLKKLRRKYEKVS